MSKNTKAWTTVTDPEEINKIDKATRAVLNDERPAGSPASGSAGVPWGGSDAFRHWQPTNP